MTWTLRNSSNDPGEIAWFAFPTSGTIEPFGETVITVIAPTQGLNARETAYLGFLELFSDSVCECREQSIEISVELVVTADTSAANSYVDLINSNSITASGELSFYIIPVDNEGLIIQDSGAVQFNPVLSWDGVGHHGGDEEEAVMVPPVVCSVKYLTTLGVHVGTCRMPTLNGVPLAGSFSLSVELASGELVGGSDSSIEVASCPEFWFYHKPSGACVGCDLDKSVCRGGKELPVPKKGYWSDLENAELGYAFILAISAGATTRDLVSYPP